ncbi:hypothetical protein AAZX31_08G086900 [Glycine max]
MREGKLQCSQFCHFNISKEIKFKAFRILLCNPSAIRHLYWLASTRWEVGDNARCKNHRLFICGNSAYGAERWVMTLERMCERFASASAETIYMHT